MIRGHGKVDFAIVVAPIKVDLDVFVAGVIDRDIGVFFEGLNEVIGIMAELDWSSGGVLP